MDRLYKIMRILLSYMMENSTCKFHLGFYVFHLTCHAYMRTQRRPVPSMDVHVCGAYRKPVHLPKNLLHDQIALHVNRTSVSTESIPDHHSEQYFPGTTNFFCAHV